MHGVRLTIPSNLAVGSTSLMTGDTEDRIGGPIIFLEECEKCAAPIASGAGPLCVDCERDAMLEQQVAEEQPNSCLPVAEPCPEIHLEYSKQGVARAITEANSLCAQGNMTEAVKWLTKGFWLLESRHATEEEPQDLHSALLSNRAFANIKLMRWSAAESDCSEAPALNSGNTKARYRRALARHEMGLSEEALADVERVLTDRPESSSNQEAVMLKYNITEKLQQNSTMIPRDQSPT